MMRPARGELSVREATCLHSDSELSAQTARAPIFVASRTHCRNELGERSAIGDAVQAESRSDKRLTHAGARVKHGGALRHEALHADRGLSVVRASEISDHSLRR